MIDFFAVLIILCLISLGRLSTVSVEVGAMGLGRKPETDHLYQTWGSGGAVGWLGPGALVMGLFGYGEPSPFQHLAGERTLYVAVTPVSGGRTAADDIRCLAS